MTIRRDDLTHPKNHQCYTCGAKPGEWCRSIRHGRPLVERGKQHKSRIDKALGKGRIKYQMYTAGKYHPKLLSLREATEFLMRMQPDWTVAFRAVPNDAELVSE